MENTDDDDHGGLVLIPGDVLIQILVLLPIISLLRFKSVCKSWRALIQSSFFIHLHAATLTTSSSSNKFGTFILQTSLLCDPTETRIVMLTPSRRRSGGGGGGEVFEVEDLGFPPFCKADLAWWKIVGSCNGLICSKLRNDISLWNPATRQFRILPKSSLSLEERGLICAPDVFGFGFDVKTKDYKVVQIRPMFRYRKLVEFRVQLYSLSTNSWRVLEEEEEEEGEGEGGIYYLVAKSGQGSFDMSTDGLYLNGGSFFFRGGYGIENGKKRHFILSFDFTKEILTPIKQFPDEVVSNSTLILTYFGADKIALLLESYSSSREERRKYFVNDIWVLNNNEHDDQEKQEEEEEEKESYYWTKLQHSIRISTSYSGWILPRAISDDGEFALIETRNGGNGTKDLKLQLFNLVTKEEKPIFVFPTGSELQRADIYKPTLVSVIGDDGGGGGGNGNGTAGSNNIS